MIRVDDDALVERYSRFYRGIVNNNCMSVWRRGMMCLRWPKPRSRHVN